jgi:tetratricopeptide (TPR) repeat protein
MSDFEALFQSAIQAHGEQDFERAAEILEQAIVNARETEDSGAESDSWLLLGKVAMTMSDQERAFGCFDNAIKVARSAEDSPRYAGTLQQLGSFHMSQGDFEEARNLLRLALSVQDQIEDHRGVGRSLYQIAATYMQQNNSQEASRGFGHAIKVMKSVQDLEGVALAAHNLAVMSQRIEKPRAAFEFLAVSASMLAAIDRDQTQTLNQAREFADQVGISPVDLQVELGLAVEDFMQDDGAGMIGRTFGA